MLCAAPRQHPDSAAVAKQAAADRELRGKLLACCNGDFTLGPALDDLSPIKLILEVVPLDHIMFAIRQKVDRRRYPAQPTLTSWRDPRLLKAAAESLCGAIVIPSMVDAWSKATAKAPQKAIERAEASHATPAPAAPENVPAELSAAAYRAGRPS